MTESGDNPPAEQTLHDWRLEYARQLDRRSPAMSAVELTEASKQAALQRVLETARAGSGNGDGVGAAYAALLGQVIVRCEDGLESICERRSLQGAGVFYTPASLVEHIVDATLGPLLARCHRPEQVARLKILDPACGAGAFLTVAYDRLLEWHRTHADEGWLTPERRRVILRNNIHGIDIDPQAVTVTRFCLGLRANGGGEPLPDLTANIVPGDAILDDLERGTESYDCIVGNPPYFSVDRTWGRGDARLAALKRRYPQVYQDKSDIQFYFLARALELARGPVGFVLSRAFLEAYKARRLREHLLVCSALRQIVDFRDALVFPGAGIATCILLCDAGGEAGEVEVLRFAGRDRTVTHLNKELDCPERFERSTVLQSSLGGTPWSFVPPSLRALHGRIDAAGQPLGEFLTVGQGMQTGRNGVFGKRSLEQIQAWGMEAGTYARRARNSDIRRYRIVDRGEYLLYLEEVARFQDLPAGVQRYMEAAEGPLKGRAAYQRGNCSWWRYTWPLHKSLHDRRRLLCPYLAGENRFALARGRSVLGLTDTTVLFDGDQPEDLLYLQGLLNSRLLTFRFRSLAKLRSAGIYEYFWNSISRMPIRRIDFDDPADRGRHDRMVALVAEMNKLQAHSGAGGPRVRDLDLEIEGVVADLYGISSADSDSIQAALNPR